MASFEWLLQSGTLGLGGWKYGEGRMVRSKYKGFLGRFGNEWGWGLGVGDWG